MKEIKSKSTKEFTDDLNANFNETDGRITQNLKAIGILYEQVGTLQNSTQENKTAIETKQKKILIGEGTPSNDFGEEGDIYIQYI